VCLIPICKVKKFENSTCGESEKKERNKKIVEMYLKAWNTQQSIADALGVDQATITRVVENMQNSTNGIFHNSFKPLLYNIWNAPKQWGRSILKRSIFGTVERLTLTPLVVRVSAVPCTVPLLERFPAINNTEKRHLSDFGNSFKPLLYNIWNAPKQDNKKSACRN
jgi:hypothetical protein